MTSAKKVRVLRMLIVSCSGRIKIPTVLKKTIKNTVSAIKILYLFIHGPLKEPMFTLISSPPSSCVEPRIFECEALL